jgi:uncharacterized protein YukE
LLDEIFVSFPSLQLSNELIEKPLAVIKADLTNLLKNWKGLTAQKIQSKQKRLSSLFKNIDRLSNLDKIVLLFMQNL